MEGVGKLCVQLVYLMDTWHILWPLGIFYGYLVCFSPFWYVIPRKIWQPCLTRLGEFLRFFTWDQFFDNYRSNPNYKCIIHSKKFALILTKRGWATFWAIFCKLI
jgi:hypothetical protein